MLISVALLNIWMADVGRMVSGLAFVIASFHSITSPYMWAFGFPSANKLKRCLLRTVELGRSHATLSWLLELFG